MSPDPINYPIHLAPDSDDFRAGMAYAAHLLDHAVCAAHGHSGWIAPQIEPKACCRKAVLGFALGMSSGFEREAGLYAEHSHDVPPGTARTGEVAP